MTEQAGAGFTYDNPKCVPSTNYGFPGQQATITVGKQSYTAPPVQTWPLTTVTTFVNGNSTCKDSAGATIRGVTETVHVNSSTWTVNYSCQAAGTPITATLIDPSTGYSAGMPVMPAVPDNGPVQASCNASPAIVLSAASGAPHSPLTVTGSGYTPGSTAALAFDAGSLGSATVGTDGTFSFSATVPSAAASGAHTVTATSSNAAPQSASFTVTAPTVSPALSVSPATGAPGSTFAISGTGYQGGTLVHVQFDNTALADSTVGADGKFTVPATVPPGAATGTHTVTVTSPGTAATTATFTVTAPQPVLALSANSGTPSTHFTATGTRYTPGESVTLEFHSTPVTLGTVTVGADGTFALPTEVPADAAVGAHTVTATAAPTGTQSAPFTVTGTPQGVSSPNGGTTPADAPVTTIVAGAAATGTIATGTTATDTTVTGTQVTGAPGAGRGLAVQTAVAASPATADGTALGILSAVTGLFGLGFAALFALQFPRSGRQRQL
jgi:hypothetical protein